MRHLRSKENKGHDVTQNNRRCGVKGSNQPSRELAARHLGEMGKRHVFRGDWKRQLKPFTNYEPENTEVSPHLTLETPDLRL